MANEYVKLWLSYEAYFQPLGDAEVGRLVLGMMKYKSTGTEPVFNGNERFVWPAIKRDIDEAAKAQSALSEARANAGKLGGRPKTNSKAKKANESICFSEKAKKAMDKDKDKDKDSVTAVAVTTARADARDAAAADPCLAKAVQCYEANIGALSRYVGDRLQYWLGILGADLVCEAINRAASANARSWRYAEKILQSWHTSGVRTVEAAKMERLSRPRKEKDASGHNAHTADEIWRRIAEGGGRDDNSRGGGFVAIDGEVLAEFSEG